MKIEVTKQFANSALKVQVEDSDDKKALAKALIFTEPDVCGLCHNTNIRWTSNKAQTDEGEYTYIKRVCRKCGATSTLGSYKTGGHYWKKWEEAYRKNTQPQTPTIKEQFGGLAQPLAPNEPMPTDIPF